MNAFWPKITELLKEARGYLPVTDDELNKWVKDSKSLPFELGCDQDEWQFYELLKSNEYTLAWDELQKVADNYCNPPFMGAEFWRTMATAASLMVQDEIYNG